MSTTADIRELTGDDSLVGPEDGSVWFAPYRAYHVEDGPDDYLLSGEILKVRLVDGVAIVDLPVTPVDNLMKVQLRGVRGYGAPWYVQIPAGDCNLFTLPHIDPDTLDPILEPEAAWTVALGNEITARESADNALGRVDAVVAGTNVTVDSTDPRNPIVSATGGGGGVDTVNGDAGPDVVLDAADVGAATTAQGGKADSAVQPGDLSTVATSGAYGDLTGKPTLGTAAATAASDYATAAQGATADTAVQPGDLTTKADLVGGTVPANQLPSFVDDVLEFANLAAFPGTGEAGKIYIALDTNLTYRWSGSAYAMLDPSLALGETSGTAYRGDRGKTAYDHSLVTTGNPHSVTKADVGLSNVENIKVKTVPAGTSFAGLPDGTLFIEYTP